MTRHEIQTRAAARKALAASLKAASYGDLDAKLRYLRLAAAADSEGYRADVASAQPGIIAEDAAALRTTAARLWDAAMRYRRCAKESSRSCGANMQARRQVLGRKPRGAARSLPPREREA